MQDSKEKQCLIFVRNNANDTADRIEAYAKKSGMEVVETVPVLCGTLPSLLRDDN